MPTLMVAQNSIKSLNLSGSGCLYEEREPLDFTMSKFKSSSPTKHPLYLQQQLYGSDTSSNRDDKDDEQGEQCRHLYREITVCVVILIPDKTVIVIACLFNCAIYSFRYQSRSALNLSFFVLLTLFSVASLCPSCVPDEI